MNRKMAEDILIQAKIPIIELENSDYGLLEII